MSRKHKRRNNKLGTEAFHDKILYDLQDRLYEDGLEPFAKDEYGHLRFGKRHSRGEIDIGCFVKNTLHIYEVKSNYKLNNRLKAYSQLKRAKKFYQSVYGDKITIERHYVSPMKYRAGYIIEDVR